ncbi:MAG: putative ABC transporter permease [Clostridia bacterium]|nr:putative ABC transporter permease [Clostridia bacterium]
MVRFCGIYGVGAVCIILFAKYFNKNNITLFLGGCFIGSVVEYLISFLVEIILSTQWWDYSNNILNVNGRICLLYSIFWGILTIFLIKIINPQIDKLIKKVKKRISTKVLKTMILIVIVFLFIDCIATCFAQNIFVNRTIIEKNIEVENREEILEKYNRLYQNEIISKFVDEFWNDEKMIRTFPNIKIEDKNKNVIYLDSLFTDIKSYYYKVF